MGLVVKLPSNVWKERGEIVKDNQARGFLSYFP